MREPNSFSRKDMAAAAFNFSVSTALGFKEGGWWWLYFAAAVVLYAAMLGLNWGTERLQRRIAELDCEIAARECGR